MQIPEFRTERLILRGIQLKDEASYSKNFVDYDVIKNLSRAIPWPYPKNGVQDYMSNVILPKQGIDRWTWGIFFKKHPESLIGCVDLWQPGIPDNRGFWLGKKYWNKGIMTEAVFPVMDFAFESLGFNELIFSNAVGNLASRRIKEKTGCKLIEVRPAKFVDPKYTKQEIWRLTAREWKKHKLISTMKYHKVIP